MSFNSSDKFDIQVFDSPCISHAPLYAWVWNSACTKDVIDSQLEEMKRLGIRAFYIIPEPSDFRPGSMPTNLTPDYLTPEYFEIYAYAMKKAREMGMKAWLYDEGGWPSGGACGRVLRAHPEYARRIINVEKISFCAGSTYKKTADGVIAAFANESLMIDEGYTFDVDTDVSEYSIVFQKFGDADFPDLLNKDAVEYFLEITHKSYAPYLKEMLGDSITALFTDEPKAPNIALNEELMERYEREYGESVIPHLPVIAGRVRLNEENIKILYRFYDLSSKMYCENFLMPCKNWANENGLDFTGHFAGDHLPQGCVHGGMFFHILRALRCLDIPGVDVIWRQVYPESMSGVRDDDNVYNGFFPRYASSVASQSGKNLAISESAAVMGPGVTYEELRYVFGYQAVRGINIFNLMTISMGRNGVSIAQELPSFTEDQIYYRDLPHFNRYLERLSYISSLGKRVCETALYYPVHDFWGRANLSAVSKEYDFLGRALEKRGVDFDIIDSDTIEASENCQNGCITAGNMSYRHIVIPKNAYIPPKTAEILEVFVKGGGKVSYTADDAEPVVKCMENSEGLTASKRIIKDGEIICLFREGADDGKYKICLPYEKGYIVSPENGKISEITAENGAFEVTLALGETKILMFTEEEYPAETERDFSVQIEITDGFTFKRNCSLACSEDGFFDVLYNDEGQKISFGSWMKTVGDDYSGSCTYETEFSLSEKHMEKCAVLDLGKVMYTARVKLNGKDLGVCLAPPYRFDVPTALLKEHNTLSVTVTNTSANWYVNSGHFDGWAIEKMSYFGAELNYAKDTADGGLCGPVKLYFED